ncbi:hypothetical protein H6G64_06730 [Calothrix sp. FACHB-156]|nr:hypothetical protein [Calothrix sp. FACHB-156]
MLKLVLGSVRDALHQDRAIRDFQLKKYSIPAGRYANALSAEEAEEDSCVGGFPDLSKLSVKQRRKNLPL